MTVVNAARVSMGHRVAEMRPRDYKLMRYLADHNHLTPFEHLTACVLIKAPLYIRAQIMRHRTFSYNEISRRYVDTNVEFFVPPGLRLQAASNRQASEGRLDGAAESKALRALERAHSQAYESYKEMLEAGVCREQARGVLPNNLMTEFYMSGNLRNWVHFLKLRRHEDAQAEVQELAKKIEEILVDVFDDAATMLLESES